MSQKLLTYKLHHSNWLDSLEAGEGCMASPHARGASLLYYALALHSPRTPFWAVPQIKACYALRCQWSIPAYKLTKSNSNPSNAFDLHLSASEVSCALLESTSFGPSIHRRRFTPFLFENVQRNPSQRCRVSRQSLASHLKLSIWLCPAQVGPPYGAPWDNS